MAGRAPLVLIVVVVLGAALATRELSAGRGSEAASAPPSACGAQAREAAPELGLARTRALTLCLLNDRRRRAGVDPLRSEDRLELAAQRYADDMVERGFFDHIEPNGLDPQDRILMAGYPSTNAWTGENLAYGTGFEASPAEIVDGWMHSPGHRANVLRPTFTEIGIGVSLGVPQERPGTDAGATYVTTFGGPPT